MEIFQVERICQLTNLHAHHIYSLAARAQLEVGLGLATYSSLVSFRQLSALGSQVLDQVTRVYSPRPPFGGVSRAGSESLSDFISLTPTVYVRRHHHGSCGQIECSPRASCDGFLLLLHNLAFEKVSEMNGFI